MKSKCTLNLKKNILFLLIANLIITLLPFGILKQTLVYAADEAISTSTYKNWEVTELSVGVKLVSDFLTAQSSGSSQRPFENNDTWTEGSLEALNKVNEAAKLADQVSLEVPTLDKSNIRKDLVREQLVMTVRKLEEKEVSSSIVGYQLSLNNYPDNNFNYSLHNSLSGNGATKPQKYDVIMLLDWSGSMNKPWNRIEGGFFTDSKTKYHENPMQHGRAVIELLGSRLLQSGSDSRVRVIGANSPYSNSDDAHNLKYVVRNPKIPGGPGVINGPQINSNWFTVDQSQSFKTEIGKIFDQNQKPRENQDTMSYALLDARQKMEDDWTGIRDGATPVIFMLSDFQVAFYTSAPGSKDMRQHLINAADDYYNSPILRSKTSETPIFLQATYQQNEVETPSTTPPGFGPPELRESYPMTKEIIDDPGRRKDHWNDYRVIRGEQSWDQTTQEIVDIFDMSVSYEKWNWQQTFQSNFKYTPASINANINNTINDSSATFNGIGAGGYADYQLSGKDSAFTGYKKGDTLNAFSQSVLHFDPKGAQKLTNIPQLFAPISDAAINLNVYNGSGAENDPRNYETKETIVSTDYSSYGGKSYTKTNSSLSAKKYGTVMNLSTAKSILNDSLGTSEMNKYSFINNNIQKDSLTISFDSSNNVFDVFVKSNAPTEATLNVEFREQDTNTVLSPAEILTGLPGENANLGSNTLVQNKITYLINNGYERVAPSLPVEAAATFNNSTFVYLFKKRPAEQAKITVRFVDEKDNDLPSALGIPISKTGEVGKTINLPEDPDIKQRLKDITNDKYILKTSPQNDTNFPYQNVTVKYVFEAEKVSVRVEFVDEDNTTLKGAITKYEPVHSQVDFRTWSDVQDVVDELEKKYELVTPSPNDALYTVKTTGNTVQYIFKGYLFLESAPKVFDFGELKYNAKTQRVDNPVYSGKMVVVDTRSIKDGWHLTAKLVKPMTHDTENTILTDSLRYVSKTGVGNNTTEKILSSNAQEIYATPRDSSKEAESTIISDSWGTTKEEQGLKFQLDGATVPKIGKYSATIKLTVIAGQP